jgi:uncharacterized membrane protein
MVKKTFLKKLETSLSSLGEQEASRIIRKYDKLIDEEVSKGKDENDVVASLGNVDVIAKLYLNSDEVKEEKQGDKEEKQENTNTTSSVDTFIDSVLNYIDDTFKKVDSNLAKRILLILCLVAIGIVAISILNIPFRIIDFTGRGILGVLFDNYYFFNIVRSSWSFGLGLCFFVLIIWLVIKYTDKIVNRYSGGKINLNRHKPIKEKEEASKEVRVNNNTPSSSVFDIVYLILKVFIVILTIPLLMLDAGLSIALLLMIALMFNGVLLYGPATFLLGLVIMVSVILDIIYDVIFKGGVK